MMIRPSRVDGGLGSTVPEGDDLSYPNLWQVIQRRWVVFLVCLAVGWTAAVVYWRLVPPTYESKVQVLIMRKDPALPTTVGPQTPEMEAKVSEDLLATHMQIVQSQRIVSQALAEEGLDKLPSIQAALEEDMLPSDYVIEQLEITRGGEGQATSAHVLNIAFRHSSATDAQRIVAAVVRRYQSFLDEKSQDVNQEAANLIARAREDLESELKQAEDVYLASRKNTPLLWNGEESTNVHRTRYEQIQSELSNIRLRRSEANAHLETVKAEITELEQVGASTLERLALIDETSLSRVGIFAQIYQGEAQTAEFLALQPARLEGARAEYAQLLSLLAQEKMLLQDFGASHPEVVSTREQIAVVREFLRQKEEATQVGNEAELLDPDELLNAYVRLLENDLATLTRREDELEILAAQEEEAAKTLVAFELEDQTLRTQIGRKQELYDAVVERLRELNLASDYGGFVNEVIAPARPGKQVWPSLPLCLALGAFVGLLLGGASAAVAETRDRSFRSAEEVVRTLQLPLLAQLQNLHARQSITVAGASVGSEVCAFHRPRSREAEAFRSLRTSLFFTAQGQKMQVIASTSPNQGDGKSVLTANLAVSIAQAGRRVLLVDCDLRRPRVHDLLGVSNDCGLADVLEGRAEPWDTVQATDVENLWALPCGSLPHDPAEMLEGPAFREFLALARERYDYILLDTPPVLAVSDPCIVTAHADGVLLVLRVSRDSRPQALHSKEMLAGVGANVVGTVINGWDAGHGFGYGGQGYYYGHAKRGDDGNGYYHVDESPAAEHNGRNGDAVKR